MIGYDVQEKLQKKKKILKKPKKNPTQGRNFLTCALDVD
jgi:hypothetical protein